MRSDSEPRLDQAALFPYLPMQPAYDAGAVRNRLNGMLDKMRAAASWPWKASTVSSYRETLWPQLLEKLADPEEAGRFRARLRTEAARLDAA